jgi:hypothetical protein
LPDATKTERDFGVFLQPQRLHLRLGLTGGFFAAQREKGDSLPKSGKMHLLEKAVPRYSTGTSIKELIAQ